ncbi:hypothetical protein JZU51_00500, partial [bacterium]|nr:hypothetical protein [bacterium]
AIHRRAVEIQTAVLRSIDGEVSVAICKELQPRAKEISDNIVRAVHLLRTATANGLKLRNELEGAGISPTSLGMTSFPIGDDDWDGLAIMGNWLRDQGSAL